MRRVYDLGLNSLAHLRCTCRHSAAETHAAAAAPATAATDAAATATAAVANGYAPPARYIPQFYAQNRYAPGAAAAAVPAANFAAAAVAAAASAALLLLLLLHLFLRRMTSFSNSCGARSLWAKPITSTVKKSAAVAFAAASG